MSAGGRPSVAFLLFLWLWVSSDIVVDPSSMIPFLPDCKICCHKCTGVYMRYVHVHAYTVLQQVSRGQETVLWSGFSLSTYTWGPGSSSVQVWGEGSYPLNYLTDPIWKTKKTKHEHYLYSSVVMLFPVFLILWKVLYLLILSYCCFVCSFFYSSFSDLLNDLKWGWFWWSMPVIPDLRRLRETDQE